MRHDHAPIHQLGDLFRGRSVGVAREFAAMAADIGELERIAADPLIGDDAEVLRAMAERLRSTMEDQFDGMTAQAPAFPWWEARCRDVQRAVRRP